MKIIILGAGQVGGTLAANLVREQNDVTVVDVAADRLRDLQGRLDIRTVVGQGSHPNVLAEAGAADADMVIAVTNSDETNMIGCQIAFSLFQTPTKIARIRSNYYLSYPELFQKKFIPIDVVICPEQLVTNYVRRLIEYPGALQVLDFAEGLAQLVAVVPHKGGPLVGKCLSDLRDSMPKVEVRVAAIFRHNQSIPLSGDTLIQVGDEVFFIAAKDDIHSVLSALGREDTPNKTVMIGGGGNIGFRLAKSLEDDYSVKIIDHNPEHAESISQNLTKTTVLLGDVSDRELMLEENIEHMDVFCAVTNDDEANIMSCMLAKRLGARKVMALITRTAYVDVIEGSAIDIPISPQQATIGSILTHLRQGDIVNVHSLRRGGAEAIEVIARGDEKTSKVVGRQLKEIKLPQGARIGAIVRDKKVISAKDELVVETDDHVILFIVEKKHIHEVEKLFQVSLGFFG